MSARSGGDVVIIDYGSGNLHSAEKAFARMAEPLGVAVRVSSDVEVIRRADRLVLPGVGAFGDCRAGVDAVEGLRETLDERVLRDAAPFFGICVGMQLMADRGLERGAFEGFGWVAGDVERIAPSDGGLKIPHMGWNELTLRAAHPVLAGLGAPPFAYFVHSYAMRPSDPALVLADVDYGGPITAIVGRGSMIGTQFHPEKSQRVGLRLIENFLRWRP